MEEINWDEMPEVIKLERAYLEWRRIWSDFVWGEYGELGNIHK